MAEEHQPGLQGRLRASIARQWTREEALAEVSKRSFAFVGLSTALRSDREIVRAAVSGNGFILQFAAEALKSDRDIVLAALSNNGMALQWAAESLRADREIVLAAVSQCGSALQYAQRQLQNDRQVVLAAVSQRGDALVYAAEEFRRDREIVLAAASGGDRCGLRFADTSLLGDDSFAVEARQSYYFFRVTSLSGCSCILPIHVREVADSLEALGPEGGYIIYQHLLVGAGDMLGVSISPDKPSRSGTLLFGAEEVSGDPFLKDWPGSPAPGACVEYQLVKSKRARRVPRPD